MTINASHKHTESQEASFIEKGIIFHAQHEHGDGVYNVQIVVDLVEEIDVDLIERCWNKTINENEFLRTFFVGKGIFELKKVYKSKIQIKIKRLSVDIQEHKSSARHFIQNELNTHIDSGIAPLFRLALIEIKPMHYKLVWTFHHALLDANSAIQVLNTVFRQYEDSKKGLKSTQNVELNYAQTGSPKGETLDSKNYWLSVLQNFVVSDHLLMGKNKHNAYPIRIDRNQFGLTRSATQKLVQVAKRNKVTVNTYLLLAWGLLHYVFNFETDIVIGSVRSIPALNFNQKVNINTLPVRISLEENSNVEDLLNKIRVQQQALKEHGAVPLYDIKTWANQDSMALFDSFVDFKLKSLSSDFIYNTEENPREIELFYNTHYPLYLEAWLEKGQLVCRLNFNNTLYGQSEAEQLIETFELVLMQLIQKQKLSLNEMKFLTAKKERQLIKKERGQRNLPTICELVSKVAVRSPKLLAVQDDNGSLNYHDLIKKVNEFAEKVLVAFPKESTIAISMEHHIPLVISILGLWKANCTFLPIDPSLPEARIKSLLEAAGVSSIITDAFNTVKLNSIGKTVIEFDTLMDMQAHQNQGKPKILNPAYLIFTSGSTGAPKGVLISHHSLSNALLSFKNEFEVSSKTSALAYTSIGFDIFYLEALLPLMSGGRVVLCRQQQSESKLANIINKLNQRSDINFLQATPSLLQGLLDLDFNFKNIQKVVSGGEVLTANVASKLLQAGCRLWNVYGPTECTIWASSKRIESANQIDLGMPIDCVQFILAGCYGHLLPDYALGQLLIAGDCLAIGYTNKQATEDKFRKISINGRSHRIYTTGDIVKSFGSNRFEYVSRQDYQIKHLGHRIELGEIEHTLKSMVPGIKEAIVCHHKSPSRLNAFIVTDSNSFTPAYIRDQLSGKLPDYMLPGYIEIMNKLPLTINGKLDRRALQAIKGFQETRLLATNYDGFLDGVINLFAFVLGTEHISPDDSFLHLGGNSITATHLQYKIEEHFGVKVSAIDLLESASPRKIAETIKINLNSKHHKIYLTHKEFDALSLSFGQQRLMFFEQINGSSSLYNLPISYCLEGPLDPAILEKSIQWLVSQHRIFKLSFSGMSQTVNNKFAFELQLIDGLLKDNLHLIEEPCLLEKGEVIKGYLFKETELRWHLLFIIHHIIFDAWSISIFTSQLAEIYNDYKKGRIPKFKPANQPDYLDYIAAVRERWDHGLYKSQLKYWSKKLNHCPITSLFPYDNVETAPSFNGNTEEILLSLDKLSKTEKLGKKLGTTHFAILLAAYLVLLHKHSRQRDLVVGTTVANRAQSDTASMLGFFSNTLPIRVNIESSETFEELAKFVFSDVLKAFANEEVSFDKIVESVSPSRQPGIHPIFQVAFVFLNMDFDSLKLQGVACKRKDIFTKTSKFDLTLYARIGEDGLKLIAEYNANRYQSLTIKSLLMEYSEILNSVVLNSTVTVSQLAGNTTNSGFLPAEKQYQINNTLHGSFSEIVKLNPQSVALKMGTQVLTYQELDIASDNLAKLIQDYGVSAASNVPLYLSRSLETVIGILAILKLGCAYVPIDVATPKKRALEIIEDCKASVVLINSIQPEFEQSELFKTINISQIANFRARRSCFLPNEVSSDAAAYMIYTSGTTGKPKGVVVNHKNVLRLMECAKDLFQFSNRDTWSLFHSYAFDFSVWEIWGALLFGARLIIVPHEVARSPEDFYQLMLDEEISVLNQTPSAFLGLLTQQETKGKSKLSKLRYIIFGGEKLDFSLIKRWFGYYEEGQPIIVNMYGITETTVHVTYYRIGKKEVLASSGSVIGKPLPDLYCYITDEHMKPLLFGQEGELLVGGDGVTQGYFNQEELTSARFVDDPYHPGKKLYRSGDIVRQLPNGDLEYISRQDKQVKVSGYRIELDDICQNMQSHEKISGAYAMLAQDANGHNYISAFAVNTGISHDVNIEGNWSGVFENLYTSSNNQIDEEVLFAGWNSSYNNQAISLDHMRQWRDATFNSLVQYAAGSILEIGCGSGLLAIPLMQYCSEYWATDFSENALTLIAKQLDSTQLSGKIKLLHKAAHDFTDINKNYYDLIILNSIIQYFPSVEYLQKVVEQAVHAANDGATIFIGDIRDLRLAIPFYLSIALYRYPEADIELLHSLVSMAKQAEKELLLDPVYFINLKNKFKRISRVEILVKRGSETHELNKYRYDVLLHIGKTGKCSKKLHKYDLAKNPLSLDAIIQLFETSKHGLHFENIANQRLHNDYINFCKYYAKADVFNASSIFDPEHLVELADKNGYRASLLYNLENPWHFSLLCLPESGHKDELVFGCGAINDAQPNKLYNIPYHPSITPTEIREYLKGRLPDYMLPARIYVLPALPLNKNNKVDSKALIKLTQFNKISEGAIIEPFSDAELSLCQACAEVLGLKQVGINQNFFDLGGDSIIAIQIISRLQDRGYRLKLVDLFQANKLADVAAVMKQIATDEAVQFDSSTQQNDLLPVHHWFFNQELVDVNYWNQGFILEVTADIDCEKLQRILEKTLNNQPNYNLRYRKEQSTWMAHVETHIDKVKIIELSSACIPNSYYDAAQREINIANGPVLVALLTKPQGNVKKLALIAHHLYIDGISWQVLFRQLEQVYHEEKVNLQPGLAHAHWHHELIALRSSFEQYLDYWIRVVAQHRQASLLTESAITNNNYQDEEIVSYVLDKTLHQQFSKLIKDYNFSQFEIVLSIIILVLSEWLDSSMICVNLERHGREIDISRVDLSQSFGWYTSIYPATFNIQRHLNILEKMLLIKADLNSIPTNGLSYGVLRYLTSTQVGQKIDYAIYSGININFLGSVDVFAGNNNFIKKVLNPISQVRAKNNRRPAAIEVNAYIKSGQLHFDWHCNKYSHIQLISLLPKLLTNISEGILKSLQTGIGFGKLDGNQRNNSVGKLPLIMENLWELYRDEKVLGYCFHQLSWSLKGRLDLDAYLDVWNRLLNQLDIFKLQFKVQNSKLSNHFSMANAKDSIKVIDISAHKEAERAQLLKEITIKTRNKPMTLDSAPLWRLIIVKLSDTDHKIIMDYHLAIFDGWSLALLFQYVSAAYETTVNQTALQSLKLASYSRYLSMLEHITYDNTNHIDYKNVDERSLVSKSDLLKVSDQYHSYNYCIAIIPSSLATNIQLIAKKNRVTLNTVYLAAWSKLTARFNHQESETIFGIILSGRNASESSALNIIGTCTNIIPLRVKLVANLRDFLQQLQQQLVNIQDYSNVGIGRFKDISSVLKNKTFQSVYMFQNYPNVDTAFNRMANIEIGELESMERAHYPISVRIIPGDNFVVKISYNSGFFQSAVIQGLLTGYQQILEEIVDDL
jgi:amino acid adenylation domain-containing protein/non-ribosomal peptide synthase protein (TIGR01720 family)